MPVQHWVLTGANADLERRKSRELYRRYIYHPARTSRIKPNKRELLTIE
jgi:hypothetical protein